MDKQLADHYNRLYIKYSCFMEDTETNFLLSLEYHEKYAQLINDENILNEVKLARENYNKSKILKFVS